MIAKSTQRTTQNVSGRYFQLNRCGIVSSEIYFFGMCKPNLFFSRIVALAYTIAVIGSGVEKGMSDFCIAGIFLSHFIVAKYPSCVISSKNS